MKRLRPSSASLTALEGFDDILFGTTGLILVLLAWALTQIGIPEVSQGTLDAMAAELAAQQEARSAAEGDAAQQRAARAAAEADVDVERRRLAESEQARAQADAARRRAEDDARRLNGELSPKPVSVVVVCDGTLSMQPVLLALQQAVLSLAEIGSRLSPSFELGIVVYRGKGHQQVLALTQVGRIEEGLQSPGMADLRRFMEAKDLRIEIYDFPPGSEVGTRTGKFTMCSRMSALSGFAQVEDGVRAGIAMLSQKSEDTRTVLILVGDVGTHELGDPDRMEATDRESAKQIVDLVSSFTRTHPRARVWSVFAGDDVEELKLRDETVHFFQSVAAAAGGRGNYTDDLASLTAATVEAVFGNPNGVNR